MKTAKEARYTGGLVVGDPVSYGLWNNRQIPCVVSCLGPNGLPSELTVTTTIPYLCKEGAKITLDEEFWSDFKY